MNLEKDLEYTKKLLEFCERGATIDREKGTPLDIERARAAELRANGYRNKIMELEAALASK